MTVILLFCVNNSSSSPSVLTPNLTTGRLDVWWVLETYVTRTQLLC